MCGLAKFKNMKKSTILIFEILVYISIIAIAFYLIAHLQIHDYDLLLQCHFIDPWFSDSHRRKRISIKVLRGLFYTKYGLKIRSFMFRRFFKTDYIKPLNHEKTRLQNYNLVSFFGAQNKTRTCTPLRAPAPQAGVSTNFTIWARISTLHFHLTSFY